MLSQEAIDILFGTYTISPESAEKIYSLRKRFPPQKIRHTPAVIERARLGLICLGDLLLNSQELLDFEKKSQELVSFCEDGRSWYGRPSANIKNFLAFMDRLRVFYELNKYASIKDKRFFVIRDLKREALLMCSYLRRMRKPRNPAIPRARQQAFWKDIEELQESEYLC